MEGNLNAGNRAPFHDTTPAAGAARALPAAADPKPGAQPTEGPAALRTHPQDWPPPGAAGKTVSARGGLGTSLVKAAGAGPGARLSGRPPAPATDKLALAVEIRGRTGNSWLSTL